MLQMFSIYLSAVIQLNNKIEEELLKKKAIKFYMSLHANFHLSSDESFVTEPPAVLNTEAIEIYESNEIDDILK